MTMMVMVMVMEVVGASSKVIRRLSIIPSHPHKSRVTKYIWFLKQIYRAP